MRTLLFKYGHFIDEVMLIYTVLVLFKEDLSQFSMIEKIAIVVPVAIVVKLVFAFIIDPIFSIISDKLHTSL